jgi:hypothetical protein
MRPLQLTAISGLQAPTMGLQAGTLPATTGVAQFDISAIMNLMLIMLMMILGRA